MSGLKWHLETINWNDVEAKKFGGDVILNTAIDNFFTLADAWKHIGFRLPKQRCGYAGMRNNIEYRLTRRTFY